MDPAELFRSKLELVDSVATSVCRRARIYGADAEDFAGDFKLALMDDDYAILRRYQGRSSLGTYLSVIAQRMLAEGRRAAGRWHASAAATQMKTAGILLERAVRRDGRTIDEVLPLLQAIDPSLTRSAVQEMEAKLPPRAPRPHIVDVEPYSESLPARESADVRAAEADARRVSRETSEVVRGVLAGLTLEDRAIVRLQFAADMSVADISRALRIPQRPLYRRIERLLERIRRELRIAGIDATALAELIGGTIEFDFGLRDGENEPAPPTTCVSDVMTAKGNSTR